MSKDFLPTTSHFLGEYDVSHKGFGDRLNTSQIIYGGPVVVGGEQFDPLRHDPAYIDRTNPMGIALGQQYVSHTFGMAPLKIEVASMKIPDSDSTFFAEEKQQAVDTATDLIEASLPGMGDHVVRSGVVSLEEVLRSSEYDTDLRIIIGDFAGIGADVERPAFDTTPTILLKVNHQLERRVDKGQGTLLLDGKNPVNTDKPEELKRYNDILDKNHYMTIARLGRLGFATASTVIDPSFDQEYGGVAGVSVAELDDSLSQALQTISQSRR
jgi:hypothetical protein